MPDDRLQRATRPDPWPARARRFLVKLRYARPALVFLRPKRPVGRLATPPTSAAVLEELARLPISTWRYMWDAPDVRHLGPMAQDFAAAFGLGEDERLIDTIDADGVNMAATQALYNRVRALEARLAKLEARPGKEVSLPGP
ncbi:MAG: tail fiber domain-containing protein [Actinomycetota bacterium]|nr:tail fiber domain-containing protein [Actinomycetota bacterium]